MTTAPHDDDLPGPAPAGSTTTVHGQEVQLPGTIAAISEALPEEQRAAFEADLRHIPVRGLQQWLVRRALETVPGAEEEDQATLAKLRAGDLSGVTYADETGGA
ncbi:hypothetical protein [Streptomyces sp. NPDC049879]|uniref:hypothetical protein n=1 Tax=Streptomyces sp. NPDC049879 TaxID=3365598 RepID=UPI0037B1DB06